MSHIGLVHTKNGIENVFVRPFISSWALCIATGPLIQVGTPLAKSWLRPCWLLYGGTESLIRRALQSLTFYTRETYVRSGVVWHDTSFTPAKSIFK